MPCREIDMLSSVRNFAITFCASLLIFGLLGYLISNFAARSMGILPEDTGAVQTGVSTDEPGDTGNTPETGNTPTVVSEEGFTMLLVGTDYMSVYKDYVIADDPGEGFPIQPRRVEADILILMHADRKTGEVAFCNLPADLKVTDQGLTVALGSLYSTHGIEYLCEAVMNLTGLRVDYFMCASVDGMEKIMEKFGDINLYVPADMSYKDPVSGYDFELTHGTHKLTAREVMLYLRFNDYHDDGTIRRSNALTLLKTLLAGITSDGSYRENAKELMELYLEHVETNFTEQAMNRYLDLFFMYSSLTSRDFTYPGVYTELEGIRYFEPDISGARALFEKYRG